MIARHDPLILLLRTMLPEPATLGRARVRRAGDDLTIVSWSRQVHLALTAADELAARGVQAEVPTLEQASRVGVPALVDAALAMQR